MGVPNRPPLGAVFFSEMIHLSRMMDFPLRDALISQFVHPLFFRTNIFLFFIYLIHWLIGDSGWYEIPLYKRT